MSPYAGAEMTTAQSNEVSESIPGLGLLGKALDVFVLLSFFCFCSLAIEAFKFTLSAAVYIFHLDHKKLILLALLQRFIKVLGTAFYWVAACNSFMGL